MATSTNVTKSATVERVNVILPRPVLDDLRRLVPRARRSEVIARATARELRRLKLAALFQDLAQEPLWSAAEHAGLDDGAAIDAAVGRLRRLGTTPSPRTTRRKARRE